MIFLTWLHYYLLGGNGLNAVGALQAAAVAPACGEPSRDKMLTSGVRQPGDLRSASRVSPDADVGEVDRSFLPPMPFESLYFDSGLAAAGQRSSAPVLDGVGEPLIAGGAVDAVGAWTPADAADDDDDGSRFIVAVGGLYPCCSCCSRA